MKNIENNEKKINITFTKIEIGILKAALQLYELNQDFGSQDWMALGGGWSREDSCIVRRSNRIYSVFHDILKVKADIGWGKKITYLAKLYKKVIADTQKRTNERNLRDYVEGLEQENVELKHELQEQK